MAACLKLITTDEGNRYLYIGTDDQPPQGASGCCYIVIVKILTRHISVLSVSGKTKKNKKILILDPFGVYTSGLMKTIIKMELAIQTNLYLIIIILNNNILGQMYLMFSR